ncbi:MAG TPA: hypothetical protein DIV79_02455 [Opitutae bacterium]|nr:hypothetical protein [Opitutae bacterium]
MGRRFWGISPKFSQANWATTALIDALGRGLIETVTLFWRLTFSSGRFRKYFCNERSNCLKNLAHGEIFRSVEFRFPIVLLLFSLMAAKTLAEERTTPVVEAIPLKKMAHVTFVPFADYSAYVHWLNGCTEGITIVENSTYLVVQNISLKGDSDNLSIDIISSGGRLKGANYRYLDMLDCDGDGLRDLRLLSARGARGGQESYRIWIYDPEVKQFVYEAAHSESIID